VAHRRSRFSGDRQFDQPRWSPLKRLPQERWRQAAGVTCPLANTSIKLMLAALLLPVLALAQSPAAAPAATATPVAVEQISLEDAYKREYALLEAQKRELQARLEQTRQQFTRDRERLSGEVGALEAQALAVQSQAERLADDVLRTEQQLQGNADNAELVAATLEQARATLGDDPAVAALAEQPEDARLQATFDAALARLAALASVRREPGAFFLADGSEVQGTLLRYGNIASFGISEQGSGALAPVGGGRFRLWNAPAAEATAAALAAGEQPAQLNAFLYENADVAVVEPAPKTLLGEIHKGGLIGYVTLLLGAIALVLVFARALFLQRAGASIGAILEAVQPAMQSGAEQAIAAAKRFKGSAARVVTAALRNIDRDREHLEDIVSESILHESSRLARFGAVIITVAAVAPLLGLLGTVTGMIQTFDVITEFGTSDPKLLSGGIATALVTTEIGLIVAIPLLLAGSLLNGWAERIKDDMEKAALRVITMAHANRGVLKAGGVPAAASVG